MAGLFILYALLNVIDLTSTYVAEMTQGVRELNTLLLWMEGYFGLLASLLVIHLSAVCAAAGLTWFIAIKHKESAVMMLTLIILDTIAVCVVVNNVTVSGWL
jgi:hypothetical protein